jgi:hypothetical protein
MARSRRYRVGDRVKVKFGGGDVVAKVIEGRGPLGYGGEQLIRVEVPIDGTNHVEFEVSASSASLVLSSQRRTRSARRVRAAH